MWSWYEPYVLLVLTALSGRMSLSEPLFGNLHVIARVVTQPMLTAIRRIPEAEAPETEAPETEAPETEGLNRKFAC
jgi:hypothetical protein